MLVKLKKYGEAQKHLSTAVELNRQLPQPHYALGSLHARQKDYEKALEHYARALELGDRRLSETASRPALRFVLKTLLRLNALEWKLGKQDAARRHGERVVQLAKDQAEKRITSVKELEEYAWILLIVEPEELRDPERAMPFAKRAVERTPSSDAGKLALRLDTMARAHFLMGDVQQAVGTQRQALSLLPESSPAHHCRLLERSLGKFEAALEKGGNPR